MNVRSGPIQAEVYKAKNKLRLITATALFDGHDASINIMRRILQASGAEIIHLGHNRSVEEVVNAAVQEDVHGIAITSYQGGHVEYFKYVIDSLKKRGRGDIKVFGGGGGVIVPAEIEELHAYGVTRIYSPQDGARLGLQGMINELLLLCDQGAAAREATDSDELLRLISGGDRRALARVITALEAGLWNSEKIAELKAAAAALKTPVLGITGTGGAGKSSLTDELIRRFRLDQNNDISIAIISIDPSRKRTGGALLGDRIRMNAIESPSIFMRSLATREATGELSAALPDVIAICKLAGFNLVIVETSGIGQGDAAIVDHVDTALYVMTPEFGAASQLEKIDMLDFADIVVINKLDRKGGEDALRDVAKQYQRNRTRFSEPASAMPVFGTIASRFNDNGVTAVYQALLDKLKEDGLPAKDSVLPIATSRHSTSQNLIIPQKRVRYLAEIADAIRAYHQQAERQANVARQRQALSITRKIYDDLGKELPDYTEVCKLTDNDLTPVCRQLLADWTKTVESYSGEQHSVSVRGKTIRSELSTRSLSGTRIPKVAVPKFADDGEVLKFLLKENLPGYFPFTAGVFAFKRESEDPTRMFAGEGDAFQTNRRFKKLSEGLPAHRLSTAFDSVTLYGCDPDLRPDIFGKIGNSGVSIATLDDMKALYDGFDLCDPSTSVSMTINGPAPIILALFFNTAIDQQVERFKSENSREPTESEWAEIKARTLSVVRGTVQADILKEDQGQNTCIFSTEFALKLMGDIQEYFVDNDVRNFYSVSISGYHIAEAGANPVSQLAFTLANGFTFVESYLARGLKIDDFAPNLSFFFSNGMDPEYSVIGRVARRIWAVAMRDRYGANERSQKLKYHVQTSGRSLHAQEMSYNDIRTTLQALIAIYDNCNSLHTNAFDEAVTTPSVESVRRALAIQLIINREWGLAKNENPNQGSFIIEELTDLVEEAVLQEFEAISQRGGVLGAMETGYQRGRIQDQSLLYEHKKHDGSYPIVGVNMFLSPEGNEEVRQVELVRSSEEQKQSQLRRLCTFHERHRGACNESLAALKKAAIENGNTFAALMEAVRHCSLGQISSALYEVGGQYRRNL